MMYFSSTGVEETFINFRLFRVTMYSHKLDLVNDEVLRYQTSDVKKLDG